MAHHGYAPDAHGHLRFRVTWADKRLVGVRRVLGLTRTTEVVGYRDGSSSGPADKLPGRTDFKPFIVEFGVPRNPEFEAWADKVMELKSGAAPAKFRKEILVELLDESDTVVLACRVYRCWVSERSFFPIPDESGGADAIQRFRIENEGFVREK